MYTKENYSKLLKDVRKANQRIQKIQSRYGEGSWAINQLYEKIDNNVVNGISTLTGGIRINKNMSDIQLKAIEKATNKFLTSETSSLTGIKRVVRNVKDSLSATLGDESHKLSNDEINKLYDLVEDKEKRDITQNIGASQLWATLVQAKEQNLQKDKFYNLIYNRSEIDITDDDVIGFLDDIYEKYVIQK